MTARAKGKKQEQRKQETESKVCLVLMHCLGQTVTVEEIAKAAHVSPEEAKEAIDNLNERCLRETGKPMITEGDQVMGDLDEAHMQPLKKAVAAITVQDRDARGEQKQAREGKQ